MKVIGIAGRAGSGKNTVAGILGGLLLEQGFPVHLDSFAVSVKDEALTRGWDGQKDEHGRTLLQEIGAERRKICETYWISMLEERTSVVCPMDECDDEYLIIPDVRYLNEAEWVRRHGVLWFVTGRSSPLTAAAASHPSETELLSALKDPRDVEVVNQGTLEELTALVRFAVRDGRHER